MDLWPGRTESTAVFPEIMEHFLQQNLNGISLTNILNSVYKPFQSLTMVWAVRKSWLGNHLPQLFLFHPRDQSEFSWSDFSGDFSVCISWHKSNTQTPLHCRNSLGPHSPWVPLPRVFSLYEFFKTKVEHIIAKLRLTTCIWDCWQNSYYRKDNGYALTPHLVVPDIPPRD